MSTERAQKFAAWCKEQGQKRKSHYLDISFEESSSFLRELLKVGYLKMTDLRDDPEWFFEAHRIIGQHGTDLGGGFWTRFTVQYNLFAGTVLAAGNPQQVESLHDMQAKGELGCFGLTEKFAGVSSGMVVETIAEYDVAAKEFVITTPNDGAKKNWISQGFCADKSVVVADLRIGGKSFGPHAFLIDFRKNGQVVQNIRLDDMGRKTVANDLDNAWIAFDGLRVPQAALLDKNGGIDAQGNYVAKSKGMVPMTMIGQRLFTGRVAVAQAALVFGRDLFEKTKKYTDEKQFFAAGKRPPLTQLPQLTNLYKEADEAFTYAEKYASLCEVELSKCLKADKMPHLKLMDAIAVCKIRSVETVVQLCFRLKQTVGSRALMVGSGFEGTDSMQVAKFAEGESYVLMSKLARDRLKNPVECGDREKAVAEELQKAGPQAFFTHADAAYDLAELVMDRTMESWVGSKLPKGVARPLARL